MTQHLKKSQKRLVFRTNKISFFGVIFSQNGISPDPAKVKAVRAFSHSQNVKELRSFLGMTNYCSRSIKGYAEICRPLREFTHKEKPLKKAEACERAFVTLKYKLCNESVIYYDPRKPITVRVDASPVGLFCYRMRTTWCVMQVVRYRMWNRDTVKLKAT